MAQQGFKFRILLVDDDASLRESSALVLQSFGYEVRTAEDGFKALVELRSALPDLVISDLRMPNMNGFELLSIIRQRFPHIPVIAISGEFVEVADSDLLTDAFLQKGQYRPEALAGKIAELIEESPFRPQIRKADKAPVWVPVNEQGYFVLTCPECLRSFSEERTDSIEDIAEAECPACLTHVRFFGNVKLSDTLRD